MLRPSPSHGTLRLPNDDDGDDDVDDDDEVSIEMGHWSITFGRKFTPTEECNLMRHSISTSYCF